MSTPFFKFSSAFLATLSLVPTVAAAPISVSSPTAIAFIASLAIVPSSLILLLIAKYLYVKNRRADTASGHSHSSNPSQLPFLVGLFGSPDWEVQRKEAECSTADETNSSISSLPPGRRPTLRDEEPGMFQRLLRTPKAPGLRIPPAAHSAFPSDQSLFYALDTPASSTQSSLGNLLSDSALVRLVSRNSQNQLAEPSEFLPKSTAEIQTPARNPNASPSSFNQTTREIKSPPKVKRCTLLRRTPIPSFLPIQTPPDSPILMEPKESSPDGNFVFRLYTPELPVAHRHISHPYAHSPVHPSVFAASDFPRSPSQEFHSCDEQSLGPHPGHPSPASPSFSPTDHLLNKATSNGKSLPPSMLVNPGGGSPFFASTSGNQGLTIPRPASTSYTEERLSGQSPSFFASRSTSAITGAKLVPFSASARASVVSESPSYTSEHAYQGGTSPAVPYELEEYHDYVGSDGVFPVSSGTEPPQYRNSPGQPSSPSDVAAYFGGNIEPSGSGIERKLSFCAPGVLFPIPEEDTQPELSSFRSRSEATSSSNGSLGATRVGSLPLRPASNYGESTVSFVSASRSFRVVNQSTPGASAVGGRRTHTGAGSPPITSTPAQTTYRGSAPTSTSPNVGMLRVGTRESYPGSGDLNDGTEVSGACMSGLYEELEEWGCEWILQNQQQTSSPTRRREVGTAL